MNKPSISVMTFDGPHTPPTLRRVPRPLVPPRGALVRIEACGVCGTDLHILRGHWPGELPWPLTLGHELAGVIEELGAELTSDYMGQPLRVGDRGMWNLSLLCPLPHPFQSLPKPHLLRTQDWL